MKLENYEVHLPNYSIGDKIYDKIGPVCESYGKKVWIVGGKRALKAAGAKNPGLKVPAFSPGCFQPGLKVQRGKNKCVLCEIRTQHISPQARLPTALRNPRDVVLDVFLLNPLVKDL